MEPGIDSSNACDGDPNIMSPARRSSPLQGFDYTGHILLLGLVALIAEGRNRLVSSYHLFEMSQPLRKATSYQQVRTESF